MERRAWAAVDHFVVGHLNITSTTTRITDGGTLWQGSEEPGDSKATHPLRPLWFRRSPGHRPCSLGNDVPSIELDEHGGVRLEVFDGNCKPEVVENEELQLEVVQFGKRKTADLEGRKTCLISFCEGWRWDAKFD